eukprot:scaffold98208_cov18-Prasinocladus_malaysianus.AAC.1
MFSPTCDKETQTLVKKSETRPADILNLHRLGDDVCHMALKGARSLPMHAHSRQTCCATRLLKFLRGHLYSGKIAPSDMDMPPQMLAPYVGGRTSPLISQQGARCSRPPILLGTIPHASSEKSFCSSRAMVALD